MKHVISALVENKSGVLAHISGLFSARGFNIDSLAVGETEEPRFSRMTIVVEGDETILEQVRKQLSSVIDVVKVEDFSNQSYVERDLILMKVKCPPEQRSEVLDLVRTFRGDAVDVGRNKMTVQLVGPEQKIEAFIQLMRPYGIDEVARTGRVALARSARQK